MIETHVALLRTLCDAGDLRGADRLKAIAIRAVLDHIEWLEAELEVSEKAKIDRTLAELSAIEEVDRLRSANVCERCNLNPARVCLGCATVAEDFQKRPETAMTDAPVPETQKDWRLNEAQAEIDRLTAENAALKEQLEVKAWVERERQERQ
jgi:hypothetical protein